MNPWLSGPLETFEPGSTLSVRDRQERLGRVAKLAALGKNLGHVPVGEDVKKVESVSFKASLFQPLDMQSLHPMQLLAIVDL